VSKRTIDHSGSDVPKRKLKPTSEQIALLHLQRRWFLVDGHEMPLNIQCLSLEVIERAVRKREAGEVVFVPADSRVVRSETGESMLDWDGASNG